MIDNEYSSGQTLNLGRALTPLLITHASFIISTAGAVLDFRSMKVREHIQRRSIYVDFNKNQDYWEFRLLRRVITVCAASV